MNHLVELEALWIHDGNPQRPHAELTSGNHSDGFFNMSIVMQRPRLLTDACIYLLMKHPNRVIEVDWVVGSAFGAITMAHEMAKMLDSGFAFTEPVPGEQKQMVLKRFDIEPGRVAQMTEDVMTTGGTTRLSIDELESKSIVVADKILVLVNRSGMTELDGRKIIALIDHKMPIWTPDECPLCQQGSEAVRPKAHWDQLTADYSA